MKRGLIGTALATIAGACLAPPLAGAQLPEPATDAWRADTDAFVAVLEREHENPFFHTPEAELRAAVSAYKSGLAAMSRPERIAGLARIAALVGDGHTWMPMHAMPFDGLPPGPGFRSLPVRFELFDDGLFIVGADADHADLVGLRVVRFGGVPVEDAVGRAMELLPGDAINFSREMAPEWLMQAELLAALGLAENADHIVLTLAADRRERTETLAPLAPDARYDWITSMDAGPAGAGDWLTAATRTPLWRQPVNDPFLIRPLENAVYLRIDQMRDGSQLSFAEMGEAAVSAAEQLDAPALVIDLRLCWGGDGSLNPGLMEALVTSRALMESGRIAVLTSRQSHSAAVMLVSSLEQSTPARFYGQPTADRPNHHGETNIFVTPNSRLPIIHASEFYQTSSPDDDRRFRTPDVHISYRFSDYRDGTDPVLDAALADFEG